MFKKILVPLGGSHLSQRSLEPALVLSRQTGAELLLVSVPTADTLSFAVSEARQRALAQDASFYLETIRKSNEQPQFSIRTQVPGVDLIIMSTHGYSDLTRWVPGSVTEKVLRSAPCPVLAIRAARQPQRILITLDGSPLAERASESGLSLAQSLQAGVTMLHCVAAPCGRRETGRTRTRLEPPHAGGSAPRSQRVPARPRGRRGPGGRGDQD
jgi:nucleotide-binding universal stress UspA family protein